MSNYHLVSTLHATRVELADARKAAAAAVAAAEAKVAAARAAVDAALADGRVAFATHLFDLDLDCLGAVLSYLSPEDALSSAHTCTTLRSALFRGGLPGPLAGVCHKWWGTQSTAATKETALRALDGMEPVLGALRLQFKSSRFDEGCARLLARALDLAPRATRIDIHFVSRLENDEADRLSNVLSSPDRAFAAPPQVHLDDVDPNDTGEMLRLTRAGVCVASIYSGENTDRPDFVVQLAANTLTRLHVDVRGTINVSTRFPALRCLGLDIQDPNNFTIDLPSLTALAPHLKEIEIGYINYYNDHIRVPPKHGFGFEPRRFTQFLAAVKGVTRVYFDLCLSATLSQNKIENLGQLTALRTLRALEISCGETYVALAPQSSRSGPLRAPFAEEVITDLPRLPPRLTRLAISGQMRVAFSHPLPELRVLDWRGSSIEVYCSTFIPDEERHANHAVQGLPERGPNTNLRVPLAIPSAAIAPNLRTLLIGYMIVPDAKDYYGDFDLWTLVAPRTALRVVVIEHARLLCSAPDGFDITTAGFAAVLAREAKDLVSVHTHNCVFEGAHQPAVENFLRALEQRGGRVCRAGFEECLFCMLHDGTDLWPDGV